MKKIFLLVHGLMNHDDHDMNNLFAYLNSKKEKEEEVKKTFGEVTFVSIPQEPDETAFLTGYMKECDFEAKISLIGEIVNRIRAEF